MLNFDANRARYRFEVSGMPSDLFQVVSFHGVEEVSRPFRFEVDLVSEIPNVNFADVVNQPAHLTMMRGHEPTYVKGLVVNMEQAGRSPDYFVYRVVLMPRVWRLSYYHQSRIYQNMTVQDIITDVLQEGGFSKSSDFRFDFSGSYKPREYTVQYRETDLDFVSRLLEFEGISYYFDHDDQKEVFVMVDHRGRHKKVGGESVLAYHDTDGMMPDVECIFDVTCREQVVTGKVVLKDYNYRTPETSLKVESRLNTSMPGLYYEYGDHFENTGRGKDLARIRNEELECARRVLSGHSSSPGLRSGYLVEMEEHYRADMNEAYLLTRIEHQGSQRRAMGMTGVKMTAEEGEEVEYKNAFVAIPAATQYRPPRLTPVPRVSGIMTARIESAGGDYAYIDEEGRYRAKMHFDLGDTSDGKATRSIRMNQPYSGPNYGIHFPNHKNTEVVWACIDGNIDRPIALGTVPNPSNAAPAKAANKMQNVIRTFAGNQVILDDTSKEAQILINTPDQHRMLFDDKDDNIIIETTNKHKVTLDDKNKKIEVKTTDGHFMVMDDKNKKITLQSKDGHFVSINDKDKLMTISDEEGKNYFKIDIGKKKLVMMSKEGSIDIHAPKGHIHLKSKSLKTETTGDTEMDAANIKSEAKMDHKMAATNITAEAKMALKQTGLNVNSEAKMAHTTKGLNVTSEAGVQQMVKGTMVTVQAAGINTIQGSLVKIN